MSNASPVVVSEQPKHDQALPAEKGAINWMRGPLGGLFTSPWFDRLSTVLLRRLYLPLSRLWAMADIAAGSTAKFLEVSGYQLSAAQLKRLDRVLYEFEASRAAVTAIDKAWDEAFFSQNETVASELVSLEQARKNTHQAHNYLRRRLRFLLSFKPPTSCYQIPTQESVESIYGDIRKSPNDYFAPPSEMPPIEESRRLKASDGHHFWIRFPSPSKRTNDTVYARVHEPFNVKNPPTIIYGHGICVEFDYLNGLIDEVDTLCRMGFRVVRPEAPFHGRRRPQGYYGGEFISATSPIGVLDTFTAAITERAVLMDWCRRTSDGPVTMGGSSLGALIAQLLAGQCLNWPEALRPDALLLLMHCAKLEDALIHGSIAKLFGALEAKHEKGWSVANVSDYFRAISPAKEIAVSPGNIVSVLGRYDEATPYAGGLDLIEQWNIPATNQFLWPQGHFSLPIAMTRNHAPLRRFDEVVRAL